MHAAYEREDIPSWETGAVLYELELLKLWTLEENDQSVVKAKEWIFFIIRKYKPKCTRHGFSIKHSIINNKNTESRIRIHRVRSLSWFGTAYNWKQNQRFEKWKLYFRIWTIGWNLNIRLVLWFKLNQLRVVNRKLRI